MLKIDKSINIVIIFSFHLPNSIIFYTFVSSTIKMMKAYKVIEVIKLLKADGWYLHYTKGDHKQFKHPTKKGKVTVRGHNNETLSQFLLNSIWKQAEWK